ncbi:hypothetical protein [Archangium sp.]|uniref:hypothetical protein n=1 Tax=Archangium sp. TaxID=1872627 RepID=UPI002D4FC2F0|nr:hypothetical protein [Archangium sp.]HYO55046.1 hypothetical protein [Archangium sp.]
MIIQLVQANIREFDEGYSESEQYQRLLQARQEALKNSSSWEGLFSKPPMTTAGVSACAYPKSCNSKKEGRSSEPSWSS